MVMSCVMLTSCCTAARYGKGDFLPDVTNYPVLSYDMFFSQKTIFPLTSPAMEGNLDSVKLQFDVQDGAL